MLGRAYIGTFILDENLIDKIITAWKNGLVINNQTIPGPVNG